jgi:diguanylate cyclase (GGDEF)-like protein
LKQLHHGPPRAYRVGGEEFAVVARMNRTQAKAFAEFIRGEIEEAEFIYAEERIAVTASIGVALNPGDLEEEQVLYRADIVLYQAKALGRNRVVEYSEYYDEVEHEGSDPEIRDFDNRIRVLTERLSSVLAAKSRQMMTQYKREAEFDGLTGLFIRRYFDRRMNREFEKAVEHGRPLSLVFIDIDHFGRVNKTYGFPTGDKALQMVTAGIKRSIRTVDWAARYGGEEFCVVLPDTPEEDAVKIARRIWEEVGRERIYAFDGRAFSLTLSIGVAQVDSSDTDLETFLQRTSDRTRFAKQNGRNQVCCDDAGELCEDPPADE